MSAIQTVAVEDGNSYKIINESDFDEKTMKKYSGTLPRDTVTDLNKTNADGTFSEPTPTDIRYPNKDVTEFANNHGAHVGKSAAQMREAEGLPDAPGGLQPDPILADAKKAADDAAAKAAADDVKKAADEAKKTEAKK